MVLGAQRNLSWERCLPFVSGLVCGLGSAFKTQASFQVCWAFIFCQAFSCVQACSLLVSQGCVECLGPFRCPLHLCTSQSARDIQRAIRLFCGSLISRTSLLSCWLVLQSALCSNLDELQARRAGGSPHSLPFLKWVCYFS